MMMKIWLFKNDITYYDDKNVRNGLRLRFDRSVDEEVRRSIMEFAIWLRENYQFPIRLPIYVKSKKRIQALDGEMVCGTCFLPNDQMLEPYIRLAVGDYEELSMECGKDNALASYLNCMAHEITHYYQWISGLDMTDIQSERQARYYADKMVGKYAETRAHP